MYSAVNRFAFRLKHEIRTSFFWFLSNCQSPSDTEVLTGYALNARTSESEPQAFCVNNISFRWYWGHCRMHLKASLSLLFCVPAADYRRCILHVSACWVDSNLWAAHEILITHLCVFVSACGHVCVYALTEPERRDIKHPQLPLASSMRTTNCSTCRACVFPHASSQTRPRLQAHPSWSQSAVAMWTRARPEAHRN